MYKSHAVQVMVSLKTLSHLETIYIQSRYWGYCVGLEGYCLDLEI